MKLFKRPIYKIGEHIKVHDRKAIKLSRRVEGLRYLADRLGAARTKFWHRIRRLYPELDGFEMNYDFTTDELILIKKKEI